MVLKAGGREFSFQREDRLERKVQRLAYKGMMFDLRSVGTTFQATEERSRKRLCVAMDVISLSRTWVLKTESGHWASFQLEKGKHHLWAARSWAS